VKHSGYQSLYTDALSACQRTRDPSLLTLCVYEKQCWIWGSQVVTIFCVITPYILVVYSRMSGKLSLYLKKTPWSESASELHRPSDSRLSVKWLPTFADRGCHVVSVPDPYGRILDFFRQEPLLFYQVATQFVLTRLSGPRSRPTTFFLVVSGIEPGPPDL
jgi:hypothetical protein